MAPFRIFFVVLATLGALAIAMRFSETDTSEASADVEESAPLAPGPAAAPASQEFSLARECGADCLGVEAGYRWAVARGIERAEDCAGYSEAFRDGCGAYAREREERAAAAAFVAEERRPAVYVSLGDAPFQTHETLRR